MLERKQVITVVSIAVALFLLGTLLNTKFMAVGSDDHGTDDYGVPFRKIWEAILNLQERVENIEGFINETPGGPPFARKAVYTGMIDVEADGDVVTEVEFPMETRRYHWAEISVPQLTLDEMPSISVYVKCSEWLRSSNGFPADSWVDAGENLQVTWPKHSVAFDEGKVFITYKMEAYQDSELINTWVYITGDYKIVIIW